LAGYRASIIDYANKIDELFSKMEGVYTEVLPLNRQAVVDYFANVWEPVHTIIAALLPLQYGQDDEPEKFRSYLEKEEDRLGNNLKAVDYIIDGTDTLTLITGIGRIEKVSAWQCPHHHARLTNVLQTVFPLLYLLMKRHYEIMRIMRTKVLDARELSEGVKSMSCVQDAIRYRVDDLTSLSTCLSPALSYVDLLDSQTTLFNRSWMSRSSSKTLPMEWSPCLLRSSLHCLLT
jgi:hypothetical protein